MTVAELLTRLQASDVRPTARIYVEKFSDWFGNELTDLVEVQVADDGDVLIVAERL